jgi:hypothetical protein
MRDETPLETGPKKVSLKVASYRYAACRKCPYMKKWKKTCKLCGCFLLTKVEYEMESCPIGRW